MDRIKKHDKSTVNKTSTDSHDDTRVLKLISAVPI